MKRYILFFPLFLLIFAETPSLASHIVGGEMNYRYLGNYKYQITLTVYRDCINGRAPFDDPASIGVFDERGNLISITQAYIDHEQQVPNAINSPCIDPPTNVCYELAQYIFEIIVPAGSGACTIAYQRCCRNYSIINMADVQGTGATYVAVITDPVLAPINNNPVFNAWPPTFICKNAPFTFDHSATDPDGDSLVYELSYPYLGADIIDPQPNPPGAPPYSPIIFLPPYSITNPFGGSPLRIDPISGIMKATPFTEGQFVYGITVKEYRNNVYIGETRRDFQINVGACPAFTVASIFSPTVACGRLDANFINNSFNASIYKWDFGDNLTFSDSSSLKNPVYSYPDTGDYVAKLIAYSPYNPLCNDTVEGIVHVYPPFSSNFNISNIHCSNEFTFYDRSFGVNGFANHWLWNFGDNSVSFASNPDHAFNSPGEYTITLSASVDSACNDTMVKKVYVLPIPVADFSLALDTCAFTIETKNTSSYSVIYQWSFGDQKVDYFLEGKHKFNNPGNYNIQLVVASDSFCVDTTYRQVNIPPLPFADFYSDALLCDSNIHFFNLSTNAKRYLWDFGDGESSSFDAPEHLYSLSGYIPVSLTAISSSNCLATMKKDIYFLSRKKADFSFTIDSCQGLVNFKNVTNNGLNYFWQFGDGSTSTDKIPYHKYKNDGNYNVLLTVNNETICSDSILKTVNYESPLGERTFVPNSFTPNGDGLNDLFMISTFRPCETYKMTIFNRWGQKVFESNNVANVGWDGTFNGEKLAEDIYVYIVESDNYRKQGIISIYR